jgi:hypothetical protein
LAKEKKKKKKRKRSSGTSGSKNSRAEATVTAGVDGPWTNAAVHPHGVDQAHLAAGTLVEAITYDQYSGAMDGSALFLLKVCYPCDAQGMFGLCEAKGASSPHQAAWLDRIFPSGGAGSSQGALIHFCRSAATQCPAVANFGYIQHCDAFRTRAPPGINEPWATGIVAEKVVQLSEKDRIKKKVKELKSKLKKKYLGAETGFDFATAAVQRFKKKRKESGSSSDSSDEEDKSLFRVAPSLRDGAETASQVSESSKGKLYARGIQEMSRFIGSRGGATGDGESSAKMVAYLTSVYQGQNPVSKIGPRNAIELRTLAEALDSLKVGDLPHVADLLMQQFKAVELATTTGN